MEGNTWKGRESLENVKELVEKFEREYSRNIREVRWQEKQAINGEKVSQEGLQPKYCLDGMIGGTIRGIRVG